MAWFPQWVGGALRPESLNRLWTSPHWEGTSYRTASPERVRASFDSSDALYRQPGPFEHPQCVAGHLPSVLCEQQISSPQPSGKNQAENGHYVGNLTRNDNNMFAHVFKKNSKAKTYLDLLNQLRTFTQDLPLITRCLPRHLRLSCFLCVDTSRVRENLTSLLLICSLFININKYINIIINQFYPKMCFYSSFLPKHSPTLK